MCYGYGPSRRSLLAAGLGLGHGGLCGAGAYPRQVRRPGAVDEVRGLHLAGAQVGEGVVDAGHDPAGGLHRLGAGGAGQAGQVDRGAEADLHDRAVQQRLEQVRGEVFRGVVGQHGVAAPLRDGQHGCGGGGGHAGHAGLAAFGPHPRVQADAALGVDQHRGAGAQGLGGRGQRVGDPHGVAVDAQVAGGAHRRAGDRGVEDAAGGHDARGDADLVAGGGHDDRVERADVVGGQDQRPAA